MQPTLLLPTTKQVLITSDLSRLIQVGISPVLQLFRPMGLDGQAALVFNTAHDEATRTQVMSWLAEKYSVALTL